MAADSYRPPFQLTPRALSTLADIMRLLGRYEGVLSPRPQPKLRRRNRIRTLVGSLAIEGNRLSPERVTDILDGKRVIGSEREIREVQNANSVYEAVGKLNPASVRSLLWAHGEMMSGLIGNAGRFRAGHVGIFHGKRIRHVAPPARQVSRLVGKLLSFVRSAKDVHPILLSAVAHYEIEFIHPFSDGNGRIGRLWQHLILARFHPVFEYLPIESVIHGHQRAYYRALERSDEAGDSTLFIEFALEAIRESLEEFLREVRPEPATPDRRLAQARTTFGTDWFSRKDYLGIHKSISTATASRDLKAGVGSKALVTHGQRALMRYRFRSSSS